MFEFTRLLRQFDPETAAPSGSGLYAHAAAHELDGLSHRTEAKADSREFRFRINTHKRHENTLLIFLRNSDAVVVDFDPAEILLRGCRDRNLRLYTLRNELDRIR